MEQLDGKLVLVVGASSGIGLAAARRLAELGAKIVGVARNAEKLAEAMKSLTGQGHQALAIDATVYQNLQPIIDIGKQAGGYAGGVFCAGMNKMRPLAVLSEDDVRQSLDANLLTVVNCTRAISRCASSQGAGLVWLSSVAAIRATPGFLAYSAAKGAMISAAKVAAVELAGRKIRVNVLLAGVVKTPMSDAWLSMLNEAQRAEVQKRHPLGMGTPEDLADIIALLVGPGSRWMTGAEIVVDGGLSLQ